MPHAYLDHAATTPVDPRVRIALAAYLEDEFGNPSSRHALGVRAAEALDRARAQIARAVGAAARQVVFTSGGTEANNMAVLGAARLRARAGRPGRVLVGSTEHPSVRAAAQALTEEGFELVDLPLGPDGGLDLEACERLLDRDVVVVAQMLVNNEFGTVYPVRALTRLVRRHAPEAHVHVDAVQGLGKVELDLAELGIDSLAISAHKVHAPKGTGALVLREGTRLRPLVFGGGQQGGVRPGTENVAGAVAFGEAAKLAEQEREDGNAVAARLRERLCGRLREELDARLVEAGPERVPAICALRLPGAPAEVWQHHLEARGVYVSVGSACQSHSHEISPALRALGFDAVEARQVARFSFSRHTTDADVALAIEALLAVAPELSKL